MTNLQCSNPRVQCEAIESYTKLTNLGFVPPFTLELGPGKCGPMPGVVKIGLNPRADPDSEIYFNLNRGIPLPDECVIYCHSNQVLEHLKRSRFIRFMNDLFRVLVPGGKTMHCMPHFLSPYAAGDPSHCNLFTEATFLYFCIDPNTNRPFTETFSDYGITAAFIMDRQDVRPAVDITVYLRKPGG